jgi:hypothetical protein
MLKRLSGTRFACTIQYDRGEVELNSVGEKERFVLDDRFTSPSPVLDGLNHHNSFPGKVRDWRGTYETVI